MRLIYRTTSEAAQYGTDSVRCELFLEWLLLTDAR